MQKFGTIAPLNSNVSAPWNFQHRGSFFMLQPPIAAAVMAAQWKGVRAFAAVAIGFVACLVGASGSAYGSGGMHQLVAE
jgi:hypothetical protein